MCGDPDYMAPEMISRSGHGQPVDVWALGVLVYELLCGECPFGSDGEEDELALFKRITAGEMRYPSKFSNKARKFIDRLLVPANARPNVEQLMEMSFFSGFSWSKVKSVNGAAAPAEVITSIQDVMQEKGVALEEGKPIRKLITLLLSLLLIILSIARAWYRRRLQRP